MSLRRFQGWTPATTYSHDEHGRTVRSTVEAEWDDEQRGWMLALTAIEADTCTGCRGRISETTAQDQWGRPSRRFHVPPPTRCNACTALSEAQSGQPDAKHPQALLWQVTDTTEVTTGG